MLELEPCTGESYVDSFAHPRRPLEWFRRCSACGAMSVPVSSYSEAEQMVFDHLPAQHQGDGNA